MVGPVTTPKKRVPLVDLVRQYKRLKKEIDAAVREVLAGAHFIQGPNFDAFAQEFAQYCGASYCIPMANGTDSLILTFRALGIGPGDEVILPSMTFIATAGAVSNCGATPVFADIREDSFCLDPAQIEAKITPKTKAILPVHLYGHPADMDPILALAAKHQLSVIEDSCQAHGAKYRGRKIGSMGRAGCFSFYPSKNLGAFGDGGATITNDEALAARLRRLVGHGSEGDRYNFVEIGTNSRLDEIQAAVLRVKLRYLDEENAARRDTAALYQDLLQGVGDLRLPLALPECEPVYHLYVIRTQKRQELHDWLRKDGIMVQVHYPSPLHLVKPYQSLGYKPGSLPVSEQASAQALSLPMFGDLKKSEIRRVARSVRQFFKKK